VKFSGKLRLEEYDVVDGRQRWKLLEPLEYEVFPGHTLIVPAGFITDFASVPRWIGVGSLPNWILRRIPRWTHYIGIPLWSIFPPSGEWNRAAVLHDYLYSIAVPWCSRWLADAIFRDAMHRLGVPLWRRWCMWMAVRMFGSISAWKSNGSKG